METRKELEHLKLRHRPNVESTQEVLKLIKTQGISSNVNEALLEDEMLNLRKCVAPAKHLKPLPSIGRSADVPQLSNLSQSCPEYHANSEIGLPWDDLFQSGKRCRASSVCNTAWTRAESSCDRPKTRKTSSHLPPLGTDVAKPP